MRLYMCVCVRVCSHLPTMKVFTACVGERDADGSSVVFLPLYGREESKAE